MLFFVITDFLHYVCHSILCFFLLSPSLNVILSLSLLLFFVSSFYSYEEQLFFSCISFFNVCKQTFSFCLLLNFIPSLMILCFYNLHFLLCYSLGLSLSVPFFVSSFQPSHSLFYYCDLCSWQSAVTIQSTRRSWPVLPGSNCKGDPHGWARNELSDEKSLNANPHDLVFCNGVLICDSCLWF